MVKKLVFIGYMGSGKSTTAQRLAALTQMKMVDMDGEIEKQSGMTISTMFDIHGEQHFRSWETRVLQSVISDDSVSIIACGGGLPCREENWSLLMESGCRVIWLAPPFAKIFDRLRNDTSRPLLQSASGLKSEDEIRAHHEERRGCYAKADERLEDDVDDLQLSQWADWLRSE